MSESNEEINIKIFKKWTNKGFNSSLETIPSNLKTSQSLSFFQTILSNFQSDELPSETGINILKCVAKCLLSNNDNSKIFIDNKIVELLPTQNKKYTEQIFNIFYILITGSPIIVDEAVAGRLIHLIHQDPKKSLTLIALYSQRFSDIDNPWPIVDLLIQEGKYFTASEIAPDYISLLAFLNKKFVEYRNGRAQHCWNQVTSMLISNDIPTLKCCYGGLCAIAEGYSDGPLPLEMVALHMKEKDLQDSVLALLNVASLSDKDMSNKKLISSLMTLSEKTVKATLVLMKLCTKFSCAQVVMNIQGWLKLKLPTLTDTLRLFLVVLRHKDLRESITKNPDFVPFLKTIVSIEKGGMVPIACTILRRVPLTKELITSLSKSGFLKLFYDAEDVDDDGLTQHSKLLLTDTICRVCYVREYLTICDTIANIIKNNLKFNDAASLVAVRLCKYSRCKARMKELELDVFFKKNRNDPKYQSIAKKFIRAIADTE